MFQGGNYIGMAEPNYKHPVLAKGKDREALKATIKEQRRAEKETLLGLRETVTEVRGLADEFGLGIVGSIPENSDSSVYESLPIPNLDQHFHTAAGRVPDTVQLVRSMSIDPQALPPATTYKEKEEVKTDQPFFEWSYQRYDWLIEQRVIRELTDEEQQFVEEFEKEARRSPAMRECYGL